MATTRFPQEMIRLPLGRRVGERTFRQGRLFFFHFGKTRHHLGMGVFALWHLAGDQICSILVESCLVVGVWGWDLLADRDSLVHLCFYLCF